MSGIMVEIGLWVNLVRKIQTGQEREKLSSGSGHWIGISAIGY